MVTGDLDTLVRAVASGVSVSEAATLAGMSRTTAWRRLRSVAGAECLAQARSERRASLLAWNVAMRDLADLALDRIADLLDDPDLPPRDCIRLAGTLAAEVRHLSLSVDLFARLEALEAKHTQRGDMP